MACNKPKPLPDDFADSAELSMLDIRRKYKVGDSTILRWRREFGLSIIQDGNLKSPPENFAELYRKHPLEVIAKMHGVCKETARGWRIILGIAHNKRMDDLPDDFADNAKTMHANQLAKTYHVSIPTIAHWARLTGVKLTSNVRRPMPDDFADVAKDFPIKKLMAIYKTGRKAILRWCEEANVKPRQVNWVDPSRGVSYGVVIPKVNGPDGTIAGRASDYLKRFFAPVCKAEFSSYKGPKGSYVVGRNLMKRDDMIELAVRKGFKAESVF